MKRINFFFIFVALIVGGFYLGSQAVIPSHNSFFGKIIKMGEDEKRTPASPESPLKKAFQSLDFSAEKGLWTLSSLIGDEEKSICEVVEGIDTYAATIQAAGVSESGEPVQIIITGDCNGNQKIVSFDRTICKQSLWNLGRGIDLGDERRAKSLSLLVPMKKMNFFLVSLKVVYKDEREETVKTSPSQQKTFFSCRSN